MSAIEMLIEDHNTVCFIFCFIEFLLPCFIFQHDQFFLMLLYIKKQAFRFWFFWLFLKKKTNKLDQRIVQTSVGSTRLEWEEGSTDQSHWGTVETHEHRGTSSLSSLQTIERRRREDRSLLERASGITRGLVQTRVDGTLWSRMGLSI